MYPLKQSTALTIPIFVHDANGDPITALTDGNWTKRISKNGGAFAEMTVVITEMENGWYSLPLSTAHTDTTGVLSMSFKNSAGGKQVNLQYRVHARIHDDLCFPVVSGRGIDVDATGGVEITANQNVNVNQWLTGTPNALIAGRVDVNAQVVGDKTGYGLATNAVDAAQFTQAAADKVWTSAARTLTSLGASLVQEIWDRATTALTTVGSIGKLLVDNINATISSRSTFNPSTDTVATVTTVGSVTNPVTAGTVSDKTGYTLSAAGVQAIWDALTSALTTAGSVGKKLADWVLGSDNKAILSNNAHTGATIPTVTTVTNNVNVGTNNDKTGYALATDGISAASVSTAAGNKIADHTLRRSYANVRASSDGDAVGFRSLLGAIAKLANKWSISGSTLTVTHEDDTTSFATQSLTSQANADAVTGVDTN